MFPFAKFPGVDTLLGPEMRSTGEVMGIDRNFAAAFAKSQIAAGTRLPIPDRHAQARPCSCRCRTPTRRARWRVAKGLQALGFKVLATDGTYEHLRKAGVEVERVNKVREGRPHCVDRMLDGDIHLVINTTQGAEAIKDSFSIRRTALMRGLPYFTTLSGARAAVGAIGKLQAGALTVCSLQEFQNGTMSDLPMTPRGLRILQDELKHLREVERPKNVQDIEEARAHGDLRENAEFSAAKEQQAFIEGRMREHRRHDRPGRGHRSGQAVGHAGGVRRHGQAGRHRQRRRDDLHDRRRPRGRHQAEPDRHLGAAGPRA